MTVRAFIDKAYPASDNSRHFYGMLVFFLARVIVRAAGYNRTRANEVIDDSARDTN